jgi:hypothetical protein
MGPHPHGMRLSLYKSLIRQMTYDIALKLVGRPNCCLITVKELLRYFYKLLYRVRSVNYLVMETYSSISVTSMQCYDVTRICCYCDELRCLMLQCFVFCTLHLSETKAFLLHVIQCNGHKTWFVKPVIFMFSMH